MPPRSRRTGGGAISLSPSPQPPGNSPSPQQRRNTRANANTTTRRAGYNTDPNIQIRTAAANAYGDPAPDEPKITKKPTIKRPTLQETLSNLDSEPQRPRPEAGRAPHRNLLPPISNQDLVPLIPKRSFRDESLINTNAGFDTSSVVGPPQDEDSEEEVLPPTPKRPAQRPAPQQGQVLPLSPKRPAQRQAPQDTIPATRHSPRTHKSPPKHISPVKQQPKPAQPHMIPVPPSSEESDSEPSAKAPAPLKLSPPKDSRTGFWESLFGTRKNSPPKVPSPKRSPVKGPPHMVPVQDSSTEETEQELPVKVPSPPKDPNPKRSPPKVSPPKLPSPKGSPPRRPRSPRSSPRHDQSTFEAWTTRGGNLVYSAWETIFDWLKPVLAVFPWFFEKYLQFAQGILNVTIEIFNVFKNLAEVLFSYLLEGFYFLGKSMGRCCLILIPLLITSLLIAGIYSTAKNQAAPGFSTPSVSEWNLGRYVPETPDLTWITDIPGKIYNGIPWPQGTSDGMGYYDLFDALIENGKLSDKAIEDLLAVLPDNVVLTRDRNGDLQITSDLWSAIGDKMSGRKTHEIWDRFVKENDKKLNNLNRPDFRQRFPHIVKKNELISKNQMIEKLDHDYRQRVDSVHPEFKSLKEQVLQLQKEKDKPKNAGLSQEQVRMLLVDQIKTMVSSGQWKALVQANMKSNLNYGLTRINHWSRGTGATVDGTVTSPNYVFPFMKKPWTTRQFRRVLGNTIPVPNPPVAALEKWEEHGDCWCSPAADNDGYGPTLGVISTHQFYPDEVVIEHITPAASIAPGATPKNMELLAYVDDFDTYDAVLKLSEALFNDGVEVEPRHEFHYIKIASWTFDMTAGEPVQAFPVQLDLKQFEAPINKLVVRAKDNWGKEEYTCLYRVRVHGDIIGQEK